MKTCARCSTDKPYTEFTKQKTTKDGHGSYCSLCRKEYAKHKFLTDSTYRASRSKSAVLWMKRNRGKVKAYRKRYNSTPIGRVKRRIGVHLRKLLTVSNIKKDPICPSIGCSRKAFRTHMEQRFQTGMTWDNYGEWTIDHIKPLCLFNLLDPKERLAANLYTNLQPLWSKDNTLKRDYYPEPQNQKN